MLKQRLLELSPPVFKNNMVHASLCYEVLSQNTDSVRVLKLEANDVRDVVF